ncbi:hypothetical protein K438DRAFT_1752191 [Mycena galopus ATCC 62051]|nr:hypothetical protein K438DRAFT_1752191 [Mycena galopus ATCC 62051]
MADSEPKTRKRKKDTAVSEDNNVVSKPRKEKRRRLEATADATEDSGGPQPAVEEPPKKKPKKNKTGFPDPSDDPSLSEQASKALSYAFLQFRKRSKWKFSKPRQNWLLRNFFSDKIPDKFLALAVQYLSNVQGGVREALTKDCRSILSTDSTPEKPISGETAAPVQPVDELDQLKRARARALLDAFEAAEAEPPTS